MKNIFQKNEISIATGLVKPKTTALFFDKLWVPESDKIQFDNTIPKSILFKPDLRDHLKHSFRYATLCHQNSCTSFLSDTFDYSDQTKIENIFKTTLKGTDYSKMTFVKAENRNKGIREFVLDMKKTYNIDITPIYISETIFGEDMLSSVALSENSQRPLIVAMENIPTIIEDKLEWKQVLDFKKDKKSTKKLKNFRNWANKDLINFTEEQIKEIYVNALDDYKKALKKHGVLTTIGAISIVLSTTSSILDAVSGDLFSKLVAGIDILSELSVFIPEQYYLYTEIKSNPAAYIYDILKLKQ